VGVLGSPKPSATNLSEANRTLASRATLAIVRSLAEVSAKIVGTPVCLIWAAKSLSCAAVGDSSDLHPVEFYSHQIDRLERNN
jgi:hypothetical protein